MPDSRTQTGKKEPLFATLRTFPRRFWILNILQMLEKLAYWSVLLQMSVYIAQKDLPGGLHWEQSLKGIIFFVWAMLQNLTPFFLGGLADRFGRKKILIISLLLIILSYLILGTQTGFAFFFAGILLLGFASGLFKPALQGALAANLNEKNSSTGWGVYFMLLNLAVIAAPPLSKYLKEISWPAVFFGSAAIMLLNLIFTFFWQHDKVSGIKTELFAPVKTAMKEFARPRVYIFILSMSGFAIVYMQFYETFQNFIIDWSDTSSLAASLPGFITSRTARGLMISYEWLYLINSILITLFVVYVSRLTGRLRKINAIILGILLSATGLTLAGSSMAGGLLITGFVIYTFGEMITNPKFTDYLSTIAPENEKSMYLGFLNLSMAIGLGAGALLGGGVYGNFAGKSGLAVRYMNEHGIAAKGINSTNAFSYLAGQLNINEKAATELLWSSYQPWTILLPFLVIALCSAACLWWYSKKWK